MNILLNQPVRIYDVGSRDTNMPLVATDSTRMQFQIQSEDIYGEFSDWSVNGDMGSSAGWTFLGASGMSITGGELTGTVTGTAQVDNDYAMKSGEVYRITLEVTENTGGLYLDQDDPIYFYGVGTYQVLFQPSTTQKVKLRFADGSFTVDNLSIELVSDNYKFIAYLEDSSGTFEQVIGAPTRDKNYLTYSLLFNDYGIAYDKYNVKILDPLTNSGSQCLVKNGYFANKEDSSSFIWDIGEFNIGTFRVNQDGGVSTQYEHLLEWDLSALSSGDTLTQSSILNDGVEYTVTFEIVSISTATIDVFVGTNTTSYTTTGAKSTTLTCTGNTDLKFVFTPDDASGGSASIKTVNIVMTDESDYTPQYESSYIDFRANVCDYQEVRCVFNNYVLGLGDAANFIPTALYPAKIVNAEYEDEDSSYTNSIGRRSVYYFEQRKNKTLITEILAEYQHDFISILKGFDNVYIGSKEYSIMDQYTVDYALDNYGRGQLLIGEKTQDRTANNKLISSAGIDVSSSGSFLVDPNGNFLVDPSGNNIIAP
jgi:hypothetical protein